MKNYKIKVVNLKRRNDRKKNVETIFNKVNFESYEFYEAVDGKNISATLEIKNLFKDNDFCYRKCFIGCALSHYNIWIDLLKDKDSDYYIIFEDDFTLSEYFSSNFNKAKIYTKNNLSSIDLLFLGYHTYNSNNLDINSYSNDTFSVIHCNRNNYLGGTFSYIITKNGAQKMLTYIDNNGIKHGIDYLLKINDSLHTYEVYPNIVFSKWVSDGNSNIDSDIQKDIECFSFDSFDNIENIIVKKDKDHLIIGFHSNQLSERGTEIALYDYANHNEKILGNKSIIFFNKNSSNNCKEIIEIFHLRFTCYGYDNFNEIDDIVYKENINLMYDIKYGTIDNKKLKNCSFINHSVFFSQPHGYKYAVLHEAINKKYKTTTNVVPHMIDMPNCNENIREILNIPKESIVLGRIGGINQFDVQYALDAIIDYLNENEDIYIVLVNTKQFFKHKNIIYIDKIIDKYEKAKFINSCDAMIHARSDGETFGLSIGEFCFYNKPIITTPSNIDNIHLEILGEKAIIYNNKNELLDIFKNIRNIIKKYDDWNLYKNYTPHNVMRIFNDVFLKDYLTDNIINSVNKKINFIFIKNLDHHGDDIYFNKVSLDEQFKHAEKDPDCNGFNTLGFFKNKIDVDNLKSSIYFKDGDGIYIKKSVYEDYLKKKEKKKINKEFINIKMLCNWISSEQLCKEWSNMCEYEFVWKNYKLVWSDVKEDIDYYVIINYPPENSYFDPKKTIVFQMEPWVYDQNKNWGVKTWGPWAIPNPNDFLAIRGRKTNFHNNAFWQLELSLNELNKPEFFKKTKGSIISSICSSKYFDEGHISRIDFLKFLEAKGDVMLDIWNQDNKHGFSNYRGVLTPYLDKSKGLKEYKYYFMIENNYEPNFITEKLWEPILCETLVFYYGCPNVTNYIDSNAFVLLDINDFEKSYQLIKQALREDWWSQRIDIIRKEKNKILDELAFFPTIDSIIYENKKLYEYDYEYEYNKYFREYNNSNYKKLLNFLHNYYSSAWLGHLQFAMWLVNKYKPKVIVELGVDYGHSTFAFASEGIGNVYGIDSFEGDIHAGHRDTLKILEDTKKYLLDFNFLLKDNIFPIKGYFDNVYETFNYNIDILHIDGLHTYEAVSNDFNRWITKTNDNSIILLHDVISFKDSVGKFFNEIPYPKTFFTHSAGLGIVSKNQDIIDNINNVWLNNSNINSNPKKYCFIHSCNFKEVGTSILNDIISNLVNSNSIQYFEKIFIVNIGEKLDHNNFQNNKIEIINHSENTQLYEIPTINLIRTFCEYNDNCEILYLHTKGVTHPINTKIIDWKNMMIYFLVNNCKDCFELLKEYDTVGCNYQEAPYKHYSGNFWWAKSNYIKQLNIINNDKKRHEAEWWILSNKSVKYYEIHNSGINHYHENYPLEKYTFQDKKFHIYSVFHNYFYDELYTDIENEEENKMITLYGVKKRQINTTKLNMIYEADLEIYNPNFQKFIYNECSALYHLYKNGLYKKYDYIGICQYDMKFFSNTMKKIKNIINNSSLDYIFNIGYFPDLKDTGFNGGHGLIINRINELPSGLETYNKFFNTYYTTNEVIKNLLIHCNTFVIPSKMFENMMDWMEQYFINDLILNKRNSDCDNPGCAIEGLVGMFLSLEVYKGAKYYPFDIQHIWPLYKNKSKIFIDDNYLEKNNIRNKIINYIKNDICIGNEIKNGNYWEEWMFKYIQQYYIENTNIIDLGGNIGTTTLLMSEVLSNNCKIFTFEPIYSDILFKNISDNNLNHKVVIYPYGVGNEIKTLKIKPVNLSDKTNFGGVSIIQTLEDKDDSYKIDIVPLDYFNFDNISLIKIDVEHMEIEVLEGCLNLIIKCKPTIIIETYQLNKLKETSIFKKLTELGYEINIIPEGHYDYIFKIK